MEKKSEHFNDMQICIPKSFSLTKVIVKGTVGPNSIYCIAVKVRIKRKSGRIDKYYITDVYDNSLNTDALTINKLYKILICPKKEKGDKEKVILYGSYKT